MAQNVVKLKGVAGYDGRQNDVIYSPPLDKTNPNKLVVYFGGDVQVRVGFLIPDFCRQYTSSNY